MFSRCQPPSEVKEGQIVVLAGQSVKLALKESTIVQFG